MVAIDSVAMIQSIDSEKTSAAKEKLGSLTNFVKTRKYLA
jgi:hypothetical protein